MKTQKIKISQGDRFGILVVQREEILHGDHNKMYRCQCDCGGTGRFSYHALTSGKVRACGCRSLSKRPEGGGYYYNGLDRVDNSIGYILGNVVPCCELCNNMKHVLPISVFLAQCKKIANKLVIGV